ncbi:hypothetical protein ACFLYH_01820 [Candidatus Dependentiae bacterium]
MNLFNKKTHFFLLMIVSITLLNADNQIVLYLQKPPEPVLNQVQMELAREKGIKKIEGLKQKTPSQISKKLLKHEIKANLIPKLNGFISLYSGYIDYSNPDGLISFPLCHISPKIYLVITPRINLINVKANTISHKEFSKSSKIPKEIYLFEKKQDKNKNFFWRVNKQNVPLNNRLNPLSLVLLTKPKNIYVAQGDFLTNNSKHIIFPENIYIVGNVDNTSILLNTIAVNRYFNPIKYKEDKISDILYRKMISNM